MTADNYISGIDVGKRIQTFIAQKCDPKFANTCRKSLWKKIKQDVPHTKTEDSTTTRYLYNEDFLGDAIYAWYNEVYPKIKHK